MTDDFDELTHTPNSEYGTMAIHHLHEKYGEELDITLGQETGGLGTWIEFSVDGQLMAVFDYFGERSHEGMTIYLRPGLLQIIKED